MSNPSIDFDLGNLMIIRHVELGSRMEILLNLIWIFLAILMVRLWLRDVPRGCASRQTQIAALAVLILFLFPVISVTDDLQAAQNLAETDVYQRRNPALVSPHSTFLAVGMMPPLAITEPSFLCLLAVAVGHSPVSTADNPALTAIHNRPPPADRVNPAPFWQLS